MGLLSNIKKGLQKIGNNIQKTVKKVTQNIGSAIKNIAPTIKEKAGAIVGTITSVCTGNITGVVSNVASIFSPTKDSKPSIVDSGSPAVSSSAVVSSANKTGGEFTATSKIIRKWIK